MKIIKKIIISILLTCFLSCLISINIYAMSDQERVNLNYKDNRDEDMPEEADVEIDGGELIPSVKLPDIELSFEKVLYGQQDLIDIDFFSSNINNKSNFWLAVRNIVRLFYRSALYISFAIMLLFIIYKGVMIALDSYKGTADNDNITNPELQGKTVSRTLKDKIFVQEWIVGMICLALLTLAINLMIGFSNYIVFSSPIGSETEEGLDNQKISVLVKGGNFPVREISILGDVTEINDFKKYMFIGDSRVVQMEGAVRNQKGDDIFIAKSGEGYDWLKSTGMPQAEEKLTKGMNVIIWMGTNDFWNQEKYIKLINSKASSWSSKGVTITVGTIRTKSI